MTTSTWSILTEHEQGLHDQFGVQPRSCTACWPNGAPPPPEPPKPAANPAPPISTSGWKSLGESLEELKRRRGGRFFGDGQAPDPEPPEAPDGNPWCDRCHGARSLAVRHDRAPTTYVPCPECRMAPWRIEKQHARLKLTIPARFASCRLETFPIRHPAQREAVEKLRAWLADPEPSWLFLSGPTGRGKTGLAVALLYALADLGHSPAFAIVTDLLTTLKSTFGSADGESESSILDVLYGADVFVLDDLGSEYHRSGEDWAAEKIFQLIAGRHAALKRTIITSNLSLDQLETKLGHPRTVRRIVEAATPRWIVDVRRMPQIAF